VAKARKTVLLRYPEVLPARTWVRNNLLWADELSAFWPTEEPAMRSDEQEQVLRDLRLLEGAGAFRSRQVDIKPEHMTQLLNRMAPEAVTGEA